jgi:hypothetical protein
VGQTISPCQCTMLKHLEQLIRSDRTVSIFVAGGLLANSVFHLYRFHKIGWTHVTGLWGHSQPISFSLVLCFWTVIPLALGKLYIGWMRSSVLAILLVPTVILIANEACGRSMLKLMFDLLLIGILLVWLLIDHGYAEYIISAPKPEALGFIVSELMVIFQISVAILTFVIATFGFSFAPNYVEKYYHQEIGQPTVWWFGFITLYLSIGVILFVSVQAWILAIRLRSSV